MHFIQIVMVVSHDDPRHALHVLETADLPTDGDTVASARQRLLGRTKSWLEWRDTIYMNLFSVTVASPPVNADGTLSSIDLSFPSMLRNKEMTTQTTSLNRLQGIEFKLRLAVAEQLVYDLRRYISVRALYENKTSAAKGAHTRSIASLRRAKDRVCPALRTSKQLIR